MAASKRRGLQCSGGSHGEGIRRGDGSLVKPDGNAAVLLNESWSLSAPHLGPVTRELRTEKFMKIVSLAPEVL